MKTLIRIAALSALPFFLVLPVRAAMIAANQLGVRAGAGILTGGAGTHFDVGASALHEFLPPISAGVLFDYIGRGSINLPGGSSTSASLTLLNATADLDTGAFIPGSFLGFNIGLGFNSTSTSTPGSAGVSNTDTDFYFGPRVGMDVPISTDFTLGGEGDFMFTGASNAPNAIEILAALKYWF